jgi:hypothetical protein
MWVDKSKPDTWTTKKVDVEFHYFVFFGWSLRVLGLNPCYNATAVHFLLFTPKLLLLFRLWVAFELQTPPWMQSVNREQIILQKFAQHTLIWLALQSSNVAHK